MKYLILGIFVILVLTPTFNKTILKKAFMANITKADSWSPRLAVLAMLVSLAVTPMASLLSRKWSIIPKGASVL